MLQFIRRLLGRTPASQLPPFDFARNRFTAKKHWPPNLRALTEKQQFRFERKFKRRLRLKSIKPQWQKWTKIVQWSMISFVVVYGVFWHDFANDPMNPTPGEQPFKGLRAWMRGLYGGMWTHTNSGLEEEVEAAAGQTRNSAPMAAPGKATGEATRELSLAQSWRAQQVRPVGEEWSGGTEAGGRQWTVRR